MLVVEQKVAKQSQLPYVIDGWGDGYGDFGLWGLAKFRNKIVRKTKRIVTSKPFKIAAGVALLYYGGSLALGVLGARKKILKPAGSAFLKKTKKVVTPTVKKVGRTVVPVVKEVGKTMVPVATQYAIQKQIIKQQAKAQKDILAYQHQLQLKAQRDVLKRQQEILRQQQVATGGRVQITRGQVTPNANNDFIKYAMVGGGILLAAMMLANRG